MQFQKRKRAQFKKAYQGLNERGMKNLDEQRTKNSPLPPKRTKKKRKKDLP